MAPRPITAALLTGLFTAWKTHFRGAFTAAEPDWMKIATMVPSTTASNDYSWLAEWPAIRKWIGERIVKMLAAHKYSVENEDYESTVAVKANHIADDQLGIYGSMFAELGRATKMHPDELVFALLAMGHELKCFDGQPFFDDEHPVGDDLVSNDMGGAGAAWYLLDTSRSLKPLIYQERQAFDLTALDSPTDPNVFWKKEFVYGVDGRMAAGFGFWQMAVRSKQAPSAANYKAARARIAGFKSDEGRPLRTKGTLVVCGSALEGDFRELLTADKIGGTTNIWRGTAELLVSPFLD